MSRVVTATYRLQLRREFPLAAARELVPYFRKLGVSHLYLSPILAARPGSTHGYDVIDPSRVNPELGTEDDLRALAADLHAALERVKDRLAEDDPDRVELESIVTALEHAIELVPEDGEDDALPGAWRVPVDVEPVSVA